MEIEIEITRKDYKEYLKWCEKKYGTKYYLTLFSLGMPFFLIVNYRHIFDLRHMTFEFFEFVCIWFGALVLMRPMWLFVVPYFPSKSGGIMGKHIFKVSEEGFWESTKYNKTLIQWNGIQSIENNEKYIFVFIDRTAAHVIPRRYFKSEEETRSFCNFMKSKVPVTANRINMN